MMYRITIKPRNKFDHWRSLAIYWNISSKARERLEWMIFYHSVGNQSVKAVSEYFGISRKTFWKWKSRFNPHIIQSLEEKSKAPKAKRVWTVTAIEERRMVGLRLESKCKWGKEKLKREYLKRYHETVSTNKIQKVINVNKLYPDPSEHKKKYKRLRSRNSKPKTRIKEFIKLEPSAIVWHTDSVVIWWYGVRRIIFTAIEDRTKLSYARIYESASSRQAKDFLKRLVYLTGEGIKVIHSDNGGEFRGEFEKACEELNIKQVYSRVKTPKDNPFLERFNWTIQDEWLSVSEVGLDVVQDANLDLTEWIIKYNFQRPHQALDYKTPIEYALEYYPQVLPMTPASTNS